MTFARAAAHLTNYTAGHETLAGTVGSQRLDYPDRHVEVDNRLSWFLGHLDDRFGDEAFYVHLTRDPATTAASFERRWTYSWRAGIIEAFAHGLLQHPQDWSPGDRMAVCRYYVDTVDANIRSFLRGRPRRIDVRLESAAHDFASFWAAVGGEGDLQAALGEWQVQHNASRPLRDGAVAVPGDPGSA